MEIPCINKVIVSYRIVLASIGVRALSDLLLGGGGGGSGDFLA